MKSFVLLMMCLVTAGRVAAAEPDFTSDAYAEYLKTLSSKLTPGLVTVVGKDPPQSVASIAATESDRGTLFTLRFGTANNPRTVKCEYLDAHPTDGVKAIDAIFAKALDWKQIATAHNVDDLSKSLGIYDNVEYVFRITGDELKDGIYLDPGAKAPAFSISEIRQLHSIFGFILFLDGFQGGSHLLESYLQQTRQDMDALFK